MKTRRITPLFLATFGLAGLLASACAKDAAVQPQAAASAQSQPAAAVPDPVVPTPAPAASPAPVTATIPAASVLVVNPDAANTWSGMKDLTFDQRGAFIAGLTRLEAIVDTEVSALERKALDHDHRHEGLGL